MEGINMYLNCPADDDVLTLAYLIGAALIPRGEHGSVEIHIKDDAVELDFLITPTLLEETTIHASLMGSSALDPHCKKIQGAINSLIGGAPRQYIGRLTFDRGLLAGCLSAEPGSFTVHGAPFGPKTVGP